MNATKRPPRAQEPATIADQLYSLADPLVKSYRTDLTHDRNWTEANPGKPFLWQARETGTTIIHLYSLDDLPGPGVYVPYLFGSADAEHIAREVKTLADCLTAEYSLPSLLLCYCNGWTIRKVDREEFRHIAEEHTYRLTDQIRARSRGR